LDGFVIWGDVAYKKCTFMSPAYWRRHFKPWVARMTEAAHAAGLRLLCYTVNDPAEAMRLREIGLDGLITDSVDRIAALD
ncbi:MAG: hypothetical protein IH616_20595, partial [Gemmatimonadales bacterium]|nr:hypothetical protein [Gemmatimonadales bacterium]